MSTDEIAYALEFTETELTFLYQVLDNIQVSGVPAVRVLNNVIEKVTEYYTPAIEPVSQEETESIE